MVDACFLGDDVMSFRLGGAWQVAGAAGIVEGQLEEVARREVGEDDLGLGPGKGAGDPDEIETMRDGHGTDP